MKTFNKIIASTLAIILILLSVCIVTGNSFADIHVSAASITSAYDEYINKIENAEYPKSTVTFDVGSVVAENGAVKASAEYKGREVETVKLLEQGNKATFTFDVKNTGFYKIGICYRTLPSENNFSDVEIKIAVDDRNDLLWLDALKLERIWADAGEILEDEEGNQTRPEQKELNEWNYFTIKNMYFSDIYHYFEEGSHTFSITSLNGGIEICNVELYNEAELPTYKEISKGYDDLKNEDFYKKIEAEDYSIKSSISIVPESDPTSVNTSPSDPVKQILNYISGSKNKAVGSWVEWKINVPNDGLYMLDLRARQNYTSGLSSMRELTIDGQIPFKECAAIPFGYTMGWEKHIIGGEKPYKFYLTAGEHTIRLTSVYGDSSKTVSFGQEIILKLNELYNTVIMKIGTNPDKYRDYNLSAEIKGIKEILSELYNDVSVLDKMVTDTNEGKAGSALSTVQTLKTMLGVFKKNPDELAMKMDTMKNNIESLASWINSLNEQPLDIDYIRIYNYTDDLPKEKASWFESIRFDFLRLLSSFTSEYNIKNSSDEVKSLTVWASVGRDQLKVLKRLCDDDFSKQSGAKVNLAINTDITSAILAGVGPDVSLFLDSSTPVNFAVRNVLVDLSKFEDYSDVYKNFDKGADNPFTSVGGSYAVPLTISWPMMFVRDDIFEKLELEVPKTWDQMYNVAAVLQRNHLEIGIPSHIGMFLTLLYQNGGEVFNDNLETTFYDQHSLNAFSTWSSFFSEYSFPLSYDIFNRFRTGEMPIGIADYSLYAQIKGAAPEIQGQWTMHPIPATLRKDGSTSALMSISNATGTTAAGGLSQGMTVGVIFKDNVNVELSWDFLKWFSSAEVQSEYGLGIEAELGCYGRYTPANLNAIKKLPWTSTELSMLSEARKNIVFIEEYPGNYVIAREVNNAFRSVVNESVNPADILSRKNVLINKELNRKNKQFGITKEGCVK